MQKPVTIPEKLVPYFNEHYIRHRVSFDKNGVEISDFKVEIIMFDVVELIDEKSHGKTYSIFRYNEAPLWSMEVRVDGLGEYDEPVEGFEYGRDLEECYNYILNLNLVQSMLYHFEYGLIEE